MKALLVLALCTATALAQDGAALYKTHCAMCHDVPREHVPPTSALRAMSPGVILASLESGSMKTQGAPLSSDERNALVIYLALSTVKAATPPPATAFCKAQASPIPLETHRWKGWGADYANTRFVDAKAAGMTAADVPKLKLKWAFGLGDGVSTHAQVAVSGDHVFAANLTGQVYSLDARSGCIQWTYDADKPVRSSIVLGPADRVGKQPALFFGDAAANAHGVDAATGKQLWKVHVEDHPAAMITGTPLLREGVLYVPISSFEEVLPGSPKYECCTFRGSVVALDAATGATIWKTYTIADPPQPTTKDKNGVQLRGPSGAGVWSAPTYDEKLSVLYVATGDNYSEPASLTSDAVLAFDAKTGKLLWSKQMTTGDAYNMGTLANGSDFDFGQPPILVSLANGHRALVIGQKSGVARGIDPDNQGAILWQTRLGKGGSLGGIQWGSAADRDNMYAAVSDVGFRAVKDASAGEGNRSELDPTRGGGLFALRLATGEKVWAAPPATCGDRKHCSPAQSAAVTAMAGVVFSGSVDGHLRAYSTANGQVLWDMDTARAYDTVNGQTANGGSLDGPGPVIHHGMLYVDSGYGQWGGMPGNVLLAYSVDGK
jgi:polyvinyl alcohol dehydrogenase (cytochrome)